MKKEEEKKYGFIKVLLILIGIAILLSWLIPNGEFNGAEYVTESALTRVGINDFSWLIYYGFRFCVDKIILLLMIGGLYGVLTKTKAYDDLTTKIANKFKNKFVAVVIFSSLIAILTSFLTESFVLLIFIPFIISIMNKMKLDKMTIFATTFGSMLVGILGATYGTEGLTLINKYNYFTSDNFNPSKTILIRVGILLIGLVLFNFFTISHMKKSNKKNSEKVTIFESEEIDTKKKNIIPLVIIGILLIILVILAFTNWSSWKAFIHENSKTGVEETIFETMHSTVNDVKIGNDFYIFKNILGSNMEAFGTWTLYGLSSVLLIFIILIGVCYRFKINEFLSSFAEGCKKVIKPGLLIMGMYVVMTIVYMSPYLATIINKMLSLTEGFNVATTGLSLMLCNLFSTNLDFVAYTMTSHIAALYPDFMNVMYVMIISLFGLTSFIVPTSLTLGIGLTSLDVSYKDWLKHIWKFIIGMLICLIVIFLLMTII